MLKLYFAETYEINKEWLVYCMWKFRDDGKRSVREAGKCNLNTHTLSLSLDWHSPRIFSPCVAVKWVMTHTAGQWAKSIRKKRKATFNVIGIVVILWHSIFIRIDPINAQQCNDINYEMAKLQIHMFNNCRWKWATVKSRCMCTALKVEHLRKRTLELIRLQSIRYAMSIDSVV